MINSALYTSNNENWETPVELFNLLNNEFVFDLDVAASHENALCKTYYTKDMDALDLIWSGTVWCNPPYGRKIEEWVKKAHQQFYENEMCKLIVMLLPARTDTRWFHNYLYNKVNVEIRFLRGRLKFSGAKNNAPFPSMIVVWKK